MNNHFNLNIHLSAFWEIKRADKKLKPHHIVLYVNLLLKWQKEKKPVLLVTSYEMIDDSNLGSRRTYFRYMKELYNWGYIKGYRKGPYGAIVEMNFLPDPVDGHIVS